MRHWRGKYIRPSVTSTFATYLKKIQIFSFVNIFSSGLRMRTAENLFPFLSARQIFACRLFVIYTYPITSCCTSTGVVLQYCSTSAKWALPLPRWARVHLQPWRCLAADLRGVRSMRENFFFEPGDDACHHHHGYHQDSGEHQ